MITHENTGLTRAIVHEVMHDTTAVNEKETTSRMPTSGNGEVRMCTPVEYHGHCASKDCCVCVFKHIGFPRSRSGRGVGLDRTHHVSGESIRSGRQ